MRREEVVALRFDSSGGRLLCCSGAKVWRGCAYEALSCAVVAWPPVACTAATSDAMGVASLPGRVSVAAGESLAALTSLGTILLLGGVGTMPTLSPDGMSSCTKPYNATSFNEYVMEGSAPVLPETQRLYNKLISLGIKPVFVTGRTEDQRAITVANLRREGYSGWMKLMLKPVGYNGTAIGFKSGERQKLQDAGYVIVGNIGDQWSDILGAPEGARTFKLPDPLYYIG
ncbi:hypothetical protein SETIT_3G110300v2 [Setaria italica]|uniref:Acid phosphatase n=1 Tax=Setaria italica TaxID=4555 RepID=A0A368QDM0_SETIT|nr:hypothetical protein SETIT_3G110300v2 [Setaria italica]